MSYNLSAHAMARTAMELEKIAHKEDFVRAKKVYAKLEKEIARLKHLIEPLLSS